MQHRPDNRDTTADRSLKHIVYALFLSDSEQLFTACGNQLLVGGAYAFAGEQAAARKLVGSPHSAHDLGYNLSLIHIFIPDPVYPVYVDTNVMAGRKVVFMDATAENGFLPLPDASVKADIIYICSPNNPTGAAYDRAGLKAWVDYANAQNAVILYDAAYELSLIHI